jgi:NUMOD1 domain
MSASQKAVDRTGDNNPCFGRTGEQHPMFGRTGDKNPMFGKPRPAGSGRPSQQIEVLDKETNLIPTYDSISAAARALDIRREAIKNYFAQNQQKPYKNRYIFKKIIILLTIPCIYR